MFAVAQLAARAAGQSAPSWRDLGRVNFLPELGFTAWWLWLATNGLGEETGWRGLRCPDYSNTIRRSSAVLLTVGWAGWHLPAFFYLPSYEAIGLPERGRRRLVACVVQFRDCVACGLWVHGSRHQHADRGVGRRAACQR